MWDPKSIEEENETFIIKVWKPLPSRHILKPRGEAQKESPMTTISISSEFGLL